MIQYISVYLQGQSQEKPDLVIAVYEQDYYRVRELIKSASEHYPSTHSKKSVEEECKHIVRELIKDGVVYTNVLMTAHPLYL